MKGHIYHKLSQHAIRQIEALHALCLETSSGPARLGLVLPEADTVEADSFYGLYYIEETLVSFLSFFCPDGHTAEISGFTAPDFRNRGYFSHLHKEAKKEAERIFGTIHPLYQCLLTDPDTRAFCQSHELSKSHSECILELPSSRIASTIIASGPGADTPSVSLIRSDDQNHLARLHQQIFDVPAPFAADYIGTVFMDQDTVSYLICKNTVVLGLLHLTVSGQTAYLMGFGILPDHRRKGAAGAALRALSDLLPKDSGLFLQVSTLNTAAFRFYIRFGFRISSRLDYVSGRWNE